MKTNTVSATWSAEMITDAQCAAVLHCSGPYSPEDRAAVAADFNSTATPIPAVKPSAGAILSALATFAASRPGLDPRNYGHGEEGWKAYRSEAADVSRDLRQARALIRACELRPLQITAERLTEAFRAYAGRLSCEVKPDGTISLDYCPGQYYCVEFRRAVCAVLASALWDAWRSDKTAPARTGHDIRAIARRELGRAIASRWFN